MGRRFMITWLRMPVWISASGSRDSVCLYGSPLILWTLLLFMCCWLRLLHCATVVAAGVFACWSLRSKVSCDWISSKSFLGASLATPKPGKLVRLSYEKCCFISGHGVELHPNLLLTERFICWCLRCDKVTKRNRVLGRKSLLQLPVVCKALNYELYLKFLKSRMI